MRKALLATVFVLTGQLAFAANYQDSSTTVAVGSNTIVVPAVTTSAAAANAVGFSGGRSWQRILNVGTSPNGPVAWCTRFGIPTIGGAGSWPLAPAGNPQGWPWKEELGGSGNPSAPSIATRCTASGGTVNITAEAQ